MKTRVPLLFIGLVFLVLMSCPPRSEAFYELDRKNYGVALTGSMNVGIGPTRTPGDSIVYNEREEWQWNGDLRLLADAWLGSHLKFRSNVLQNVHSSSSLFRVKPRTAVNRIERSGIFSSRQQDDENARADLVLDSINIRLSFTDSELIVGRQPVGLATTFYFTPNDFFAPFAAQSFYRIYKPGVDAVRFERRLTDLSRFSVIGVLGYRPDLNSDNGWSSNPDWRRTSLLGCLSWGNDNFEWGLTGGKVRDYIVYGGSFQEELFQWLGIRAEGHYQNTQKDHLKNGLELSLGVEHRFPGSLTLRLEQFYHGSGFHCIADVDQTSIDGQTGAGSLGRDYTAFAVSNEFSPLLMGEFLVLKNWTDQSQLYSLYAVYSLSDESELALTASLPVGEQPNTERIRSEFGSLPAHLFIEYRFYF